MPFSPNVQLKLGLYIDDSRPDYITRQKMKESDSMTLQLITNWLTTGTQNRNNIIADSNSAKVAAQVVIAQQQVIIANCDKAITKAQAELAIINVPMPT